jgi:hypothetical protein
MDKKIILSRNNVRFEPVSLRDTTGRIFYWNNRVFREIRNETAWNFYTRFLKSEVCPKLFDAGLIRTWIPPDVELEGVAGIVEHEKIECILSPAEWTLTMLWDSANMVVHCLQLLSQENYGFKDGHPFNVQFINCSPVWIDFGSITNHIGERMWCAEEFRRTFIVPLWVAKYGGDLGRKIAYELIRECDSQPHTGYIIFSESFLRYLPIRYFHKMKQFEKCLNGEKKPEAEQFFINLKTYVNALKPNELENECVAHQSCEGTPRDSLKDALVVKLLMDINPESVIDFRADDGFYSFHAENCGYKVISAEWKETRLSTLYKRAQLENRRITPVRMDFLYPTPQCLIGLGYESSFDRLNADVSLALDFMDDAILLQFCSMELFTEIISRYSKKASIIEYISPTGMVIEAGKVPGDYSRENLVHEMHKRGFSLQQAHYVDSRENLVHEMHTTDFSAHQDRVIEPGRDILVFVRD